MTETKPNSFSPAEAQEEVQRIREAARLLGVSVDESDVSQWLTAMAAGATGQDWQVDARTGVFGHRITLLDFDAASLDRYRRIADIVQFPDRPNVETAIALSGSAAQGKIQPYPGDYDFFERINIIAPTREESTQVLAQIIREKALEHFASSQVQLVEVKFGTWQSDVVKEGETIPKGKFVSWAPAEVQSGRMEVFSPDGEKLVIPWEYGCQEPGWCKLDWMIAISEEGRVVNASNMLDVTWQSPSGDIVPLDGFLDPYFQEVYLESSSIPLFAKLAGRMPPQVVSEYVGQLQHEVRKYAMKDPRNFGKVAKRLYNIFRLIGRYQEAAWIRELFDEPTSALYQVLALLETVDDAAKSETAIDREAVIGQVDALIRQVIDAIEGPKEGELVMSLLRLRDDLSGRHELGDQWDALMQSARCDIAAMVNDFFEEKLMAIPEVRVYIEELEKKE
jgi:hypothetical protein